MKAITIKQPWASLIVEGVKDIENRTWKTSFRGRVLVHAAAKPDNIKLEIEGQASYKEIQMFSVLGRAEDDNLFGCIIGSVEITDCVINHPSIWAEKTPYAYLGKLTVECQPPIYNFVLANPIIFPEPIPCKGKLSFWDYPGILAKPEEKAGELFCHCQLPVNEESQVSGNYRFGYYCRYCGGKWYK